MNNAYEQYSVNLQPKYLTRLNGMHFFLNCNNFFQLPYILLLLILIYITYIKKHYIGSEPLGRGTSNKLKAVCE